MIVYFKNFNIQLFMLLGFSTPMLLSPELAELMGETHVSFPPFFVIAWLSSTL